MHSLAVGGQHENSIVSGDRCAGGGAFRTGTGGAAGIHVVRYGEARGYAGHGARARNARRKQNGRAEDTGRPFKASPAWPEGVGGYGTVVNGKVARVGQAEAVVEL